MKINKFLYINVSFITIPILVGLYAILIGQDINWDLLNYHLYNPYAFLNNRVNFDLAPAGLQSYFNPTLDIWYYWMVKNFSPRFIGFIIGFIQGLSYIPLFFIAYKITGKEKIWDCMFLAIAGLCTAGFLSEIGTTFHDSLINNFVLLSLLFGILGIKEGDSKSQGKYFLLSGLMIGFAAGLKLVFVFYGLAIAFALFSINFYMGFKYKNLVIFIFFGFIGFFSFGGYWIFKMWIIYGNPIFPSMNNIFLSNFAAFEKNIDMRFLPKSLFEKIYYPFVFTNNPYSVSEIPYRTLIWPFGFLSVILYIYRPIKLVLRKVENNFMEPDKLFLLSFILLAYLLWLTSFGIYRYLISIEVILPLIIYISLQSYFPSDSHRFATIAILAIITSFNFYQITDWGHSKWSDKFYVIDTDSAKEVGKSSLILISGQPIAWIVPALNINIPFVQVDSNFPVSKHYWRVAREIVDKHPGERILILESNSSDSLARTNKALENIGLRLDPSRCDKKFVGHIAQSGYEYTICRSILEK